MVFKVYLVVCAIMSLATLVMFGIDKLKAKKDAARFPELTLLTLSALGGGVGGAIGMLLFRHKTNFSRKPHFVIGVPLCAVLEIAMAVALFILK